LPGNPLQLFPFQNPENHHFTPGHTGPLHTLRKVLEQVEAHRLNSFIHQNHILPLEQFGFHQQHSSLSQLARITNFITHGFNLSKHTGMVLLDIGKAYDTGTKTV
jgi:hypothetical protein